MGRHNYIAGGSVPNLVTTNRPIYKVPTGRLKVNPYHWKPGKVVILAGWPFNGVELDDTITIPTQEPQEQEQDTTDSDILDRENTTDIVKEVDSAKAYREWYNSR